MRTVPGRKDLDHHQRGYALLLALFMVVLMAFSIAGLARASLAAALDAQRVESDLRRRWATLSSRRLLAAQLPELLDEEFLRYHDEQVKASKSRSQAAVRHRRPPPTALVGSFQLGGQHVEFRFADEEAKVNLNTLSSSVDSERELERRAENLLAGRDFGLSVNLQPHSEFEREQLKIPPYTHLGQVVATVTPAALVFGDGGDHDVPALATESSGQTPSSQRTGVAAERTSAQSPFLVSPSPAVPPAPLDRVTLWGTGRLRLQRAADVSVETLLKKKLRPEKLAAFLAARRSSPSALSAALAHRVALSVEEHHAVRRLLSDRDDTYSLWLRVSGARRASSSLSLHRRRGGEVEIFSW